MVKAKVENPKTKEHVLDSDSQPKIPLSFMAVEDLEYKDEDRFLDDLLAMVQESAREVDIEIDPETILLTGTEDPRLKKAVQDNLVFAATLDQTRDMIKYSDDNSPLASARKQTEHGQTPMIAVWDSTKLRNLEYDQDFVVDGNPAYAYQSPDGNLRGALVGIVEFIPEQRLQKMAGKVGKVAIWG